MAMRPMGAGGRASAVGIELAVAVVGSLVAGWWLDGKFGTSPYLTLFGVCFGAVVGFRALWRVAKASAEEEE